MNSRADSKPMESMTGYAVHELSLGGVTYKIHLKSVNHRYFEMKWRGPRAWLAMENEARGIFQKVVHRGTVDCWVDASSRSESGSDNRAEHLFTKLNAALETTRAVGLPKFLRALILSQHPEGWLSSRNDSDVPEDIAIAALKEVAAKLLDSRRKEGARLREIIGTSKDKLTGLAGEIQNQLPAIQKAHQDGLKNRLMKLAHDLQIPPPSEQKLLQEFLTLAEKRDCSEETDRISVHLKGLSDLLADPPAHAGKKIEFTVQELLREWTTLGTKIHDPAILKTIMEAKLELDRIREQAANIA